MMPNERSKAAKTPASSAVTRPMRQSRARLSSTYPSPDLADVRVHAWTRSCHRQAARSGWKAKHVGAATYRGSMYSSVLSPPPVGEWTKLDDASGSGYLSVYLSEPLARYPIRHISRPADNKSDPNIETATFGLFSTCEQQMRAKIVREERPYLFFATKHRHKSRVLTGYYKIGWYTASTGGVANGDYALAASEIKFVDPILFNALPEPGRTVCVPWFRTIRPLEAPTAAALLDLLEGIPDRTQQYLAELHRLERFSVYHSGYSYPSWGRVGPFSWADAARYLGSSTPSARTPSTPRSGLWRCAQCQHVITSKARLKACPVCQAVESLTPEGV